MYGISELSLYKDIASFVEGGVGKGVLPLSFYLGNCILLLWKLALML